MQGFLLSDTYSSEVGTWFEGMGFLGCHLREKGGLGEGLLVDVAGLVWAEYGMYTNVQILSWISRVEMATWGKGSCGGVGWPVADTPPRT